MRQIATRTTLPQISEVDRRAALALARRAVTGAVAGGFVKDLPRHGLFGERRGAFVTLRVSRKLRGCIGVIEPECNVAETLVKCARSAALEDPRFSPVRPEELGALIIEISLLSPIVPIQPEDIEIGRHGLLVARGGSRGVLLPQVAVEHGLDREQFLTETCRKAGLNDDAWRDPKTAVFGFTAEHFCEEAPA
jgi:AmmeMemoRadiSam system protein A